MTDNLLKRCLNGFLYPDVYRSALDQGIVLFHLARIKPYLASNALHEALKTNARRWRLGEE